MILGHAFPPVVEAIREAAGRGASFGASHAGEAKLAELVRQLLPVGRRRCASSAPAPRPACRPFAWRAGLPGAISSSSSKAAITATPTRCWSRRGPVWRRLAFPARQAFRPRPRNSTLALPYNDLAAVEAAFAARPQRDCMHHRGAGRRQCRDDSARAWLSRRPAAAVHAERRAADRRRGDDRLPALAGRRAAAATASRPT